MTHLVFLSGGPDSSYSLKKVLTTTDDPVIVCFIDMNDPFGRSKIEKQRVEFIVAYCKSVFRDFEFRTFNIDLGTPKNISDVTLCAPFAASVINAEGTIKKIWMGVDVDEGFHGCSQDQFQIATEALMNVWRHKVKFPWDIYPIVGQTVTKAECREFLGETLWNLTWSCRMPVNYQPCGECFACIAREKSRGENG